MTQEELYTLKNGRQGVVIETSDENNKDRENIEYYLTNTVIPDIIHCMNESSEHNKYGRYGFYIGNKKLTIDFQWKDWNGNANER